MMAIMERVRAFIARNWRTSTMFMMAYYLVYAAIMATTGQPVMIPNITVSFMKLV